MEISTIIGLILGVGGILLGFVFDGGHLESLFQISAFFIVVGGTLGATIMSNSKADLKKSIELLGLIFKSNDNSERKKIAIEVIDSSKMARRQSILSLEKNINNFTSSYMRNVFRFMLDGVEPAKLKEIFETEIAVSEESKFSGAKVWADAAGFAPTIGIIGAVLGLIHVMGNMSNTDALGKGIAVAFVATFYGIGFANLIFLPIFNKIRQKVKYESETKEMILSGAISIFSGMNPYIIEEKMRIYVDFPSQMDYDFSSPPTPPSDTDGSGVQS